MSRFVFRCVGLFCVLYFVLLIFTFFYCHMHKNTLLQQSNSGATKDNATNIIQVAKCFKIDNHSGLILLCM